MKAWKRICQTSWQQSSMFYTLIDYGNDFKIFKTQVSSFVEIAAA